MSDAISLEPLVAAKKFVDQIGGPEKAQGALAALAKLPWLRAVGHRPNNCTLTLAREAAWETKRLFSECADMNRLNRRQSVAVRLPYLGPNAFLPATWFIAMCAFVATGTSAADGDAAARRRFLEEYPSASRRIEAVYDNVKVTSDVMMDSVDVVVNESRTYWATDGAVRCDVIRKRSIQPGYAETDVRVITPAASFILTKNSKPGSDRFRIGSMGAGATNEEPARYLARPLAAPTFIYETPIRDFIRQRTFKIDAVTEEDRGDQQVVVVKWTNPLPTRKRWGEFIFDADSWVALETKLNLQGADLFENGNPDDKVLFESVRTYGEPMDGIPIIKKIEEFGTAKQGRHLNEVEEVTSSVLEKSPPEHFSLAAFGMNARALTPRRTGLYVIIGLTVGALGLFAVMLGLRRRWRAA